jgi:nucleotide-binding universal stress UspA family protein
MVLTLVGRKAKRRPEMYNKILIPVDFTHQEQSYQTLEKARKLGGEGGIILLHVIEEIPSFILAQLPKDLDFEKVSDAQNELEALAQKAGIEATIEVRKGGSYNAILESATENKVDLIIINSHRPGVQDYLLGSTAAKVVRHATCAVLVER